MRLVTLAVATLIAFVSSLPPTHAAFAPGGPPCGIYGECWETKLLFATVDGRYGNATLLVFEPALSCAPVDVFGSICTYAALFNVTLITPSPGSASAVFANEAATVHAGPAVIADTFDPHLPDYGVGTFAAAATGAVGLDARFAWGHDITANVGEGTLDGADAVFAGHP
ncbi:MAG: hypothetical protein ACYDCK_04320 [Thermoplasmatota archaeon]